ncbi:MAG: GntR family transcriptional regulator [Gammaproteobacteria bacterium]|nr:GntR family transcriptional regulator [Gammaproteobacteria bacterium]NNF59910.1 GntR family transcriptional regulator [Gammaproteobacteria bacterium]NNM21644.1 GntR family transcriptional regulator [Gammaproteobacteria bacterium]
MSKLATLQPLPGVPAQVADHLTELIIRGELAPGERIPEARITAALGVSRGSVRAALQILERRYLVELPPRRGAFVSRLTGKNTRDLYSVLKALFVALGAAAAQAWESEDDLAGLRQLGPDLQSLSQTDDELALVNFTHKLTDVACDLAGNDYLTRIMQDLRPLFSRSFYRALAADRAEPELARKLLAELINGVERRDARAVEQLLQQYGDRLQAIVLSTF